MPTSPLISELEDVRVFIEREYRDPRCEPDGEWLAKEAREPHRKLVDVIEALTRPQPTDEAREGVVEALTPSGDTKAAYMGEFAFKLTRVDDAGDEYSEKVSVPWTTIKEIMAAIRKRAALSSLSPDKGGMG